MLDALELFAGIGGLSLGLERAGINVVGQVEKDPWATKILEKHWPEVPRHDDVRTALDWWRSEPRPRVDLVVGGYPCQGESLAGRRGGADDDRWLWPEFARIVSALRPRYVLGENVLGHRTKGLRFVLRDLELLGYTARAGTLSAGEVGAPHRRRRILVLAERADLSDAERELVRVESGRSGRPYGTGAALAGEHGPLGDVAGCREAHGGWTAEPDMGRVAHGVPDRVDRLRGLGNAVVPAVGEAIGRLLLSGAWRDV